MRWRWEKKKIFVNDLLASSFYHFFSSGVILQPLIMTRRRPFGNSLFSVLKWNGRSSRWKKYIITTSSVWVVALRYAAFFSFLSVIFPNGAICHDDHTLMFFLLSSSRYVPHLPYHETILKCTKPAWLSSHVRIFLRKNVRFVCHCGIKNKQEGTRTEEKGHKAV